MSRSLFNLFDRETPKLYVGSSFRSRRPEHTLDLVAPHLGAMGITRVANVTGLDRIGIPVVLVVRPNGRGLAVAQGKGVDLASAKASGVLESVENHHAEYTALAPRRQSYAELGRAERALDPERLPLSRDTNYAPERPVDWVEGFDLMAREPAWVPFELVHADARYPQPPGGGAFARTTNGLASGNTLAEAVVHGLCEVIERDALTLFRLRGGVADDASRVDAATVDDPACRDVLGRLERAGIDALIWDVTSDVGVPCYYAMIYDRSADVAFNPLPGAFGSGCHLAPGVALARALLEAAQSRLTYISGSRDDHARTAFVAWQSARAHDAFRETLARRGAALPFRADGPPSAPTVEGDVSALLARLRPAGVARAAAVDLSRPGLPVSVARVVVEGLEGSDESKLYAKGERARAATKA